MSEVTPSLEPQRLKYAEHVFNVFSAITEPGVTKEMVLRPAYWAHCARKLQLHDKIILTTDDGMVYAELLVVARDNLWAKVHILTWVPLQTKDTAETEAAVMSSAEDAFSIEYKGNHRKHVVIRKSDNAILFEGAQRRADAVLWLQEHLKVTA